MWRFTLTVLCIGAVIGTVRSEAAVNQDTYLNALQSTNTQSGVFWVVFFRKLKFVFKFLVLLKPNPQQYGNRVLIVINICVYVELDPH